MALGRRLLLSRSAAVRSDPSIASREGASIMLMVVRSPVVDSDFALLAAWREGDRNAGQELLARYFDAVYGFFRSKIEHLAEDLTQQTFLRCVEARDDVRQGGSFRCYLFVVARNELYGHLRRASTRTTDPDFEVSSLADLVASPSTLLVAREEHKLLVHALRRLPLSLQVALELRYVQRLRGDELAEVLGVPLGTVRSRIRRGVEQLRENVAKLSSSSFPIRTTVTDLQRWAEHLRASAPR
jgi:RNA polymerase sigma factor (sigma-70 family)